MKKSLKASKEFTIGKNNIAWIGSNFKEHFFSMSFKASTEKLQTKRLERNMFDKEILAEFKPGEMTLGNLLHALNSFDHNSWYIFYIRDADGVLWAVRAYWHSVHDGWHVEALSVERPGSWRVGRQVVSRRFSDAQTISESSDILTLENLDIRLKKLESLINPELLK